MTADIELLPLPEHTEAGEFTFDAHVFEHMDMVSYARANVAHATAAKDAEISLLRVERDTVVKEAAKYAERSGRAQAEVDRLQRMVQERDNMLGRRPCAGVNADGKPRCFELVDARAEIEALRAEVEAVWAAMPRDARYLDPPDGGCVPLHEQVRRMAADATRAERLAGALRELLIDMKQAQSNMKAATQRDPRWEGCADAIQPRVAAAEAALRDHDQEVGNG